MASILWSLLPLCLFINTVSSTCPNGWVTYNSSCYQVADRWIGLTDQVIENEWLWYDTNNRAVFTDWAPGEPNQAKSANCAILWNGSNYRWGDNSCSDTYEYICEKTEYGEEMVG